MVDLYRNIASYIYPIFLILTVLFQSLLLYIIYNNFTLQLKTSKLLLLKRSLIELLACFIIYFLQPRLFSHQIPVEVWCYGLCKSFKEYQCFLLFMIFQSLCLAVAVSHSSMFFYKYNTINLWTHFPDANTIFKMLVFYIPAFVSLICGFLVTYREFVISNEESTPAAENAQTNDYLIIGSLKLYSIPNAINLFLIVASCYGIPIIGLYYRYQMQKELRKNWTYYSNKVKHQTEVFITGQTIQLVLPMLYYIPIFTIYYYSLIMDAEIVFEQYFIFIAPSLPVVLDPLLSLYFVISYRKAVMLLFKRFCIKAKKRLWVNVIDCNPR